MRLRSIVYCAGAAVALMSVSAPASSAPGSRGPLLHEPVPAIAGEDLTARTPGGPQNNDDRTSPANANGERGNQPNKDKAPLAAYSAKREPQHSTFRPDRDTRRPDTLTYDEPFTPSTAPFKRLVAYDRVDASYTLLVNDQNLRRLGVSGGTAPSNEDRFSADMTVEFVAGEKVRIPSVGPGTKIRRLKVTIGSREVGVRLWVDGAENWFIESPETGSGRLTMDLSVDKRAFGGTFGDPSWTELPPTSVPEKLAPRAAKVFAAVGISRDESPREVVTKMVAYFRNFVDSNELPDASKDIYLDLALSRKGVCRHRSFAFFVTASAIGIPTRMVTNEAHAWVEVFDGTSWKRIDLGGAGRMLRSDADQTTAHRPQFDPFSWPASATRGQDLATRSSATAATPADGPPVPGNVVLSDGGTASSTPGPNGTTQPALPTMPREREEDAPADDKRVALLESADGTVKRGGNLHVRGRVALGRSPAAAVVDIVLVSAQNRFVLGQVSANESGSFDGEVYLPAKIPVGSYAIGAKVHREGSSGVSR